VSWQKQTTPPAAGPQPALLPGAGAP
jgi:hypothetical protein